MTEVILCIVRKGGVFIGEMRVGKETIRLKDKEMQSIVLFVRVVLLSEK